MLGSRYIHILRRQGTVRLLVPLIARIPDSIAATAIVVLVRSVTSSYSTAGFAAGAFGIGTAASASASVSAPLTGRALDRLGQRRVLPVLAVAFAGALVALVLASARLAPAGLGALAAVAGLARPPIEAALRAMWPRIIPGGQVDPAYALDSTVQEIIWIAGPLLLALLLATGSPWFPLIACAILSIGGTILYTLGLRDVPGGQARASSASSPLRRAELRVLLICAACYGVGAGILNLALVAFAGAHGGVAWAGVLVAIWGLGSLAGGLLCGSREWGGPVEVRAMGCLALFGATLLLLAAAPGLAVLALLMIPLGLPLSPWLGSLSASVQRAVPSASSTEAFAWTFATHGGPGWRQRLRRDDHPGRRPACRLPDGRKNWPGRRSVRRTPASRLPADSALTGATGGPNSHLRGEPSLQGAGWLAIQRQPSRLRITRCETPADTCLPASHKPRNDLFSTGQLLLSMSLRCSRQPSTASSVAATEMSRSPSPDPADHPPDLPWAAGDLRLPSGLAPGSAGSGVSVPPIAVSRASSGPTRSPCWALCRNSLSGFTV